MQNYRVGDRVEIGREPIKQLETAQVPNTERWLYGEYHKARILSIEESIQEEVYLATLYRVKYPKKKRTELVGIEVLRPSAPSEQNGLFFLGDLVDAYMKKRKFWRVGFLIGSENEKKYRVRVLSDATEMTCKRIRHHYVWFSAPQFFFPFYSFKPEARTEVNSDQIRHHRQLFSSVWRTIRGQSRGNEQVINAQEYNFQDGERVEVDYEDSSSIRHEGTVNRLLRREPTLYRVEFNDDIFEEVHVNSIRLQPLQFRRIEPLIKNDYVDVYVNGAWKTGILVDEIELRVILCADQKEIRSQETCLDQTQITFSGIRFFSVWISSPQFGFPHWRRGDRFLDGCRGA